MQFDIQVRSFAPQKFAAVRAKTTIDKVTPKVTQLLRETADYLDSVGVQPIGPGVGVYYEVGSFIVDVEAGYPVPVEIDGNERVRPGELPGGKCAVAVYKGPHEDIADAHRAVHSWMHEHDIESTGEPAREIYLTDLRGLGEGEACEAESVWPVVHETRAERRRQQRAKS